MIPDIKSSEKGALSFGTLMDGKVSNVLLTPDQGTESEEQQLDDIPGHCHQ